jgi:hypothetical protein
MSTLDSPTPQLLADGFPFGIFLGAMARHFAPPTEREGS